MQAKSRLYHLVQPSVHDWGYRLVQPVAVGWVYLLLAHEWVMPKQLEMERRKKLRKLHELDPLSRISLSIQCLTVNLVNNFIVTS